MYAVLFTILVKVQWVTGQNMPQKVKEVTFGIWVIWAVIIKDQLGTASIAYKCKTDPGIDNKLYEKIHTRLPI